MPEELVQIIHKLKRDLLSCDSDVFFLKNKKEYKKKVRNTASEIIHRSENMNKNDSFILSVFKPLMREETLFGLKFGNHRNDIHLLIDKIDQYINYLNKNDFNLESKQYNFNMKASPTRFAIPIF